MKGETTLEKVFLGEWQTAVYKCQTWESVDIKGFSGGCIDRYQVALTGIKWNVSLWKCYTKFEKPPCN